MHSIVEESVSSNAMHAQARAAQLVQRGWFPMQPEQRAVQTRAAVTVALFAFPCYAVVWPLSHCHSQQPTCDVG